MFSCKLFNIEKDNFALSYFCFTYVVIDLTVIFFNSFLYFLKLSDLLKMIA